MKRALASGLLLSALIFSAAAIEHDFSNCNCDYEGFWSIPTILECQRVSDLLIAIAYFSIPIELLYFLSCANLPFKWVVFQFGAFIVLCGLTHLLNGWTYYGPYSFQLMLSLTAAKLLTALVSCATAITLLTLIPLLLKIKVREVFLTQNVMELDQEVGMMKRLKEASWHVRMLTHEIRKSLDKHTILDTTLVELSKTLDLQNCAVWMPNEYKTEMNLTHELKRRSSLQNPHFSIPINDLDIQEINLNKGVKLLRPDSALGAASSGEYSESGAVAAIRMPMLRVSNFKGGGTPELREACYAILVLVLPYVNSREWTYEELEIVEVVADQVAVALSHAAVLEESQRMREKLAEQNLALQHAKKNALMASEARNSFQKVMGHGMRRPMHSISGLLSIFHDENVSNEQRIIVDTMTKTSSVLSTLMNDITEISEKDMGKFPLEITTFRLHAMIKEASCLAKCLCVYKGFLFSVNIQNSLPNLVIGDEKRTVQVILHMFGYLLNIYNGEGIVSFRVFSDSEFDEKHNTTRGMWKPGPQGDFVSINFEIEISDGGSLLDGTLSTLNSEGRREKESEIKEGLSFTMCKKLVQMMKGNIWISPSSQGIGQCMILLLRLQIQPSFPNPAFALTNLQEQATSNSQFNNLRVILSDDDNVNRTVTKKLLEKLGCQVTAVSSGFECLSALGHNNNAYRVVLLDLHMPEIDGYEVATRIRKYRSRKRPLIIALTASAEDYVWERCLQVGMDGLIRKPVLLHVMADELRRVLQREIEGM